MGYNLLINWVHSGYNPFTKHLLTSWDILVCDDLSFGLASKACRCLFFEGKVLSGCFPDIPGSSFFVMQVFVLNSCRPTCLPCKTSTKTSDV